MQFRRQLAVLSTNETRANRTQTLYTYIKFKCRTIFTWYLLYVWYKTFLFSIFFSLSLFFLFIILECTHVWCIYTRRIKCWCRIGQCVIAFSCWNELVSGCTYVCIIFYMFIQIVQHLYDSRKGRDRERFDIRLPKWVITRDLFG